MYFVSLISRSMSRSKREEYYFSISTVYLSVGLLKLFNFYLQAVFSFNISQELFEQLIIS